MVRHEGGRWDVGVKDAAVYVERISDSDERVFEDSLTAEEARDVAGLLTKYADKLDEARDADKAKETDESETERSDAQSKSGEDEDSDKDEASDEDGDSDGDGDGDSADSDESNKSSD